MHIYTITHYTIKKLHLIDNDKKIDNVCVMTYMWFKEKKAFKDSIFRLMLKELLSVRAK